MSSFYSTRVHFIWSTAGRTPMIHPDWQERLHGYLHGILVNKKSQVFAMAVSRITFIFMPPCPQP